MTCNFDDKSLAQDLNNAQLMHPLTSGVHDLKHAYVPKADILNTCSFNTFRGLAYPKLTWGSSNFVSDH